MQRWGQGKSEIDYEPKLRMPKDEVIRKILDKIEAIADLMAKTYESMEFGMWRRETENLLIHAFGPQSRQVNDFSRIDYLPDLMTEFVDTHPFYIKGLQTARECLLSIVKDVEEFYNDEPQYAEVSVNTGTIKQVGVGNDGIVSRKVFVVHVMSEMFGSAKRPFYQSTEILSLNPIDRTEYEQFAARHFASRGDTLKPAVFQSLYDRFEGITWYVQAVLNKVWESGTGLTSEAQIGEAVEALVESGAIVFHDLLQSQNEASRALLKAVAKEGCVTAPTSGDFLSRHGFKSHSTVRSALKDLVGGDLLYKTDGGYIVYDRLFGMWLSRL